MRPRSGRDEETTGRAVADAIFSSTRADGPSRPGGDHGRAPSAAVAPSGDPAIRPHKNGCSQRGTFEMPGDAADRVRLQSTTHETYRPRTPSPAAADRPLDDRARRRKELEEHLWKTMTEKVLNDLAIKTKNFYAQNDHFETTYSSTFQIKGFKPKEIGEKLNEELCAKYPLYNTNGISMPVNWYEFDKAKQPIHKPLASLFKKDSRFTRRMSNPNDYQAPVAPEHFAFV